MDRGDGKLTWGFAFERPHDVQMKGGWSDSSCSQKTLWELQTDTKYGGHAFYKQPKFCYHVLSLRVTVKFRLSVASIISVITQKQDCEHFFISKRPTCASLFWINLKLAERILEKKTGYRRRILVLSWIDKLNFRFRLRTKFTSSKLRL